MIAKISVLATATLVSAATGRSAIALQNQSDTDIYVALDGSSDVTGAAGLKPGIKITPGGSISLLGPTAHGVSLDKAIYAIHEGSGSKVLAVQTW